MTDLDLQQLKRKFAIYTPGELKHRSTELGAGTFLVNDLLPDPCIVLALGESGIGKSALFYQLGLCVSAGIPFLGHPVQQGRVLYLDYENGLGEADDMVTRLIQYLRLAGKPHDFLLWNLNDAPAKWGQPGYKALDMIREVRPALAVLDSLTAFHPGIEGENKTAMEVFQQFRAVIRERGTSTICIHHPRKPSEKPEYAPRPLENEDPRRWFMRARGCRALVNGSDVRIGIDEPGASGPVYSAGDKQEEIALVMRGFSRVRGEIPLTYIARVLDDNGDPLGYRKLTGASLLFNADQSETFGRLPNKFRFKDAQLAYRKGPQATNDFLLKCCNLGILCKPGRGCYEKITQPDVARSPEHAE
jgi:hypothetical protein